LAAAAEITARIGGLPGTGCVERAAAMTRSIGDRANNGNGIAAGAIGCRRRIEGPGGSKLEALIRVDAGDHWRGGIHQID